MARRSNPSMTTTVIAAVAAGVVGMSIGYALSTGTGEAQEGQQWSYWVEEVSKPTYLGGTSTWHKPVIQGPNGQRFELPLTIGRSTAEADAIEAIQERGGIPVAGMPA